MSGPFATEAVRAIGDDGEVDDGTEWEGMHLALGCRNEFSYIWRLPRLGRVVSFVGKANGNTDVSTAFVALQVLYETDHAESSSCLATICSTPRRSATTTARR